MGDILRSVLFPLRRMGCAHTRWFFFFRRFFVLDVSIQPADEENAVFIELQFCEDQKEAVQMAEDEAWAISHGPSFCS